MAERTAGGLATGKIETHHLEREACLYVRQSSLRQVMENTESARRQYGLSRKAVALGWPSGRIRVIDEDQGKSGSSSAHRSGFQDLMTRIAARTVGIVIGLEVSRLARDNADWHLLLRMAGYSRTLILDENGIYDPNDSNDRLLLGVRGTISEFELEGIKARLIGGQRSAAARGALKLKLPLGLAYGDNGEVVFDPDRSIVDAVAGVFTNFRRLGSATAVVKWMHRENIPIPSRSRNGPNRGRIQWALPNFAQIRRILKNPRYAGAYVYGRTRSEPQADGTVRIRTVPMDQWHVLIRDAHPGFIDFEEYLRIQDTLASNARGFCESAGSVAPPRNGAALLQSRVICGGCGQRMGPLYTKPRPPRRPKATYYYQCFTYRTYGGGTCPVIRGDVVDAAVSRFVIDTMNRDNIDLALAVQQQVHAEFAEADRQRANRIEAIRYQAELARRRFIAVDPANRLVAAALEAEWNDQLQALDEACRERQARASARDQELSGLKAERIRALTRDFEKVWTAPGTTNVDRKRLLGLLIEDATLTRDGSGITVALRMRGGRTLTLDPVQLPPALAAIRRTPPKTVAALAGLLDTHTDRAAALALGQAGYTNWKGEPYTTRRVARMRRKYNLPSFLERQKSRLRDQGFVSARELAEQLGVDPRVVYRIGADAHDDRIERVTIPTDGRPSRMFRGSIQPRKLNPIPTKHPTAQPSEQGAS